MFKWLKIEILSRVRYVYGFSSFWFDSFLFGSLLGGVVSSIAQFPSIGGKIVIESGFRKRIM